MSNDEVEIAFRQRRTFSAVLRMTIFNRFPPWRIFDLGCARNDSREYRIRHKRTFGIEQGMSNDEVEEIEERRQRTDCVAVAATAKLRAGINKFGLLTFFRRRLIWLNR